MNQLRICVFVLIAQIAVQVGTSGTFSVTAVARPVAGLWPIPHYRDKRRIRRPGTAVLAAVVRDDHRRAHGYRYRHLRCPLTAS